MTLRKALLWILFVDFAAFSSWVMWDAGYLGIWQAGMASPASGQILLDLVIACVLISVWIKGDAESRGINPWPWMVAIALTRWPAGGALLGQPHDGPAIAEFVYQGAALTKQLLTPALLKRPCVMLARMKLSR